MKLNVKKPEPMPMPVPPPTTEQRIKVATHLLAGFAGNDHINLVTGPTEIYIKRSLELADQLLNAIFEAQYGPKQ